MDEEPNPSPPGNHPRGPHHSTSTHVDSPGPGLGQGPIHQRLLPDGVPAGAMLTPTPKVPASMHHTEAYGTSPNDVLQPAVTLQQGQASYVDKQPQLQALLESPDPDMAQLQLKIQRSILQAIEITCKLVDKCENQVDLALNEALKAAQALADLFGVSGGDYSARQIAVASLQELGKSMRMQETGPAGGQLLLGWTLPLATSIRYNSPPKALCLCIKSYAYISKRVRARWLGWRASGTASRACFN
jgi:hypothetical protein